MVNVEFNFQLLQNLYIYFTSLFHFSRLACTAKTNEDEMFDEVMRVCGSVIELSV